MKMRFIKRVVPLFFVALMMSCASGKSVVSSNVDLSKYKYVVFGNKTNGARSLDDVLLAAENKISETKLIVLSSSEVLMMRDGDDGILTPNIHVSEGSAIDLVVTFYDYKTDRVVAVVKSHGYGLTGEDDKKFAVGALHKKLVKLFGKK